MRFIKSFICILSLFTFVFAASPAFADYPRKPIKLIVPYAPGGQADLTARFLAKALAPYFPKITITNMGSAGGVTGAAFVANAKPDGYTLLLGWVPSVAISPAFYEEVPYNWDSFDHITIIQKHSFALIGGTKSGINSFKELEKEIKTGKKEIVFGTAAPSTINDIAANLMLDLFDAPSERIRLVPFEAAGVATTSVIGNHIGFLWQGTSPVVSPIQAGQVNCLAVTATERLKNIPQCPTVKELGYPQLEQMTSWGSLSGPKGLPKEVLDKWAEVLAKVASDPEWLADLASVEAVPAINSKEEATAFVEEQYELFKGMLGNQ